VKVASILNQYWTSWQHVVLNSPTVSGMSRLSVNAQINNGNGIISSSRWSGHSQDMPLACCEADMLFNKLTAFSTES
jgi:hypothetical protein